MCERITRCAQTPVLIAVSVIPAAEVFALEGRVSLPDGSPAAGAQVAIIGISGSVRADRDGRFVIADPATVPFTVIVVGTRGEIYPAVTIESIRAREEVWIRNVRHAGSADANAALASGRSVVIGVDGSFRGR